MDDQTEEFTLPALPHDEPSLPSIPSYSRSNTRKRPFIRSYSHQPRVCEDQLAEALNTSSDPALFSCDETPDAENYSGNAKRRKKKTYKGTWWGDTNNGIAKKRSFRRNFDSGIFMDDDTSSADFSSESLLEKELLDAQQKTSTPTCKQNDKDAEQGHSENKSRVHRSFDFAKEEALKRMPPGRSVNPKDHLIQTVVQACLDKNNETVDWTGCNLDYLPPTITELKSMIKRIQTQSVDDKLAPFEAELKILLGNNEFSQFPEPLLELTNTQLLSMRQNKLVKFPPGIRSLTKLEELNISSNNLQYLPYEVVQLLRFGSLKIINHLPNPWMPLPPTEQLCAEAPVLGFITARNVPIRRVAVSKPIEIQADGSPLPTKGASIPASKQPHLSEVVLRALLRHNSSKTNLSSYLSEDHPQSAKELLHSLYEAQTSGGRVCSFCKRDIVLPKNQWYEWWDVVPQYLDSIVIEPTRESQGRMIGVFLEICPNPPSTITASAEVLDRLIPFQRFSCGCADLITGLVDEEKEFRKDALTMPVGSMVDQSLKKALRW